MCCNEVNDHMLEITAEKQNKKGSFPLTTPIDYLYLALLKKKKKALGKQ